MKLVCKQLSGQILKDKVFLLLLFVLTALTSLSFFFVMFSIDGNMAVLNRMGKLTENQLLYRNALHSNTILAYNFFITLTALTAFVFLLFFYRFFRANKKQIGCIKALGFKNSFLQNFFTGYTAVLSFPGAIAGMIGGYFLSDVLLRANAQTYEVTGLTKGLGIFGLLTGFFVPAVVFYVTALLCYGFVRNTDAGTLLAGNDRQERVSWALKTADTISRIMPSGKRLPLRIALRKPLSVLLLLIAVMAFQVCIILGQSLNISSEKVFGMQTEGHNYEYEIRFLRPQTDSVPENAAAYLESPVTLELGTYVLERKITGLYQTGGLYELKNRNGELLAVPEEGKVYMNPELSEIYGVKIGDTLTVQIKNRPYLFAVSDIAVNAKSGSVYINGKELSEIEGVPDGAYNGVLSAEEMPGDEVTAREQRIDDLNRNAVSNKISAVINQAAGILAGAILIFLALYINFQDNTRDMLILGLTGYRTRDIRKMFVDVYLPVLWAAFAVTLVPAVFLARTIQHSLSVSTNDYMPFGTNIAVILTAFCLIHIIYWGVQITFSLGIRRVTGKRDITEVVNAE